MSPGSSHEYPPVTRLLRPLGWLVTLALLGATAARVPFFGDLPYIGRAFSVQQTSHGEQELIVLVTPELVHPLEPHELGPLPGADVNEPGDIEFYLAGRLESRRSYDYRSSVMTDIHRMLRYRRCEQLYIVGPSGHSDPPPPAVPGSPAAITGACKRLITLCSSQSHWWPNDVRSLPHLENVFSYEIGMSIFSAGNEKLQST